MESQIGERKRARDENRSYSETKTFSGTGRQLTSQRRPRGGRFQRNRKSTSSVSSPSLAEYLSPDLVSKFSLSPSLENQDPVRSVEESPFRSPLHKSRRGLHETTPHRGRRGPHHLGSHSSGQRGTRVRTPQGRGTSRDEDEPDEENDRRVRKCLWADEEDEAFCEADDIFDEPVVAREPPKTPTKEQLARRQKDIDYGKATIGYKNYVERVPREERGSMCPETPNKNEKVARRIWDITVRKWRRTLHQWDLPADDATVSSMSSQTQSPPGSRTASCSEMGEVESPANSVASSPSDKGYITTPGSRADRSLLDLEEEEDNLWFAEMEDFPPLPSSEGKKQWWEIMEKEEKMKEEEPLDEFVKNLSIGNAGHVHRGVDTGGTEQGAEVDAETEQEDQMQN